MTRGAKKKVVDRGTCIVKNFAFPQIKYIYMLMRIMRSIGEKLWDSRKR